MLTGVRTGPVCDARGPNPCTFVLILVTQFSFIETSSCRFVSITQLFLHFQKIHYFYHLMLYYLNESMLNEVTSIIVCWWYLQEILDTGKFFFTRARLASASEVQCDMPFSILEYEIHWASITWLVSVSNNNVTFSNQLTVFVFDSKCLVCASGASSCQQKVSTTFLFVECRLLSRTCDMKRSGCIHFLPSVFTTPDIFQSN